MPPNRLNLSVLRRNQLPRTPPAERTLPELAVSPEPLTVSRRELIGIAGTAAVALPPGGKQLGSGLRGPFRFEATHDRAAFTLGGTERWIIDPQLFTGSPRLRCSETDGLIVIELTGAKYPGAELPADMQCVIRRGVLGWRMRIKLALGGFESEAPFEAWLAGVEPARGRVEGVGTICAVGSDGRLHASGGEARFSSDWTLRINGERAAGLSALGEELASDAFSVSLLGAAAPSLMEDPPARRTLIALSRGEYDWPLSRTLAAPDGSTLHATGSVFDAIEVETGDGDGAPVTALLARSDAEESRLRFAPGGDLRDADGRAFSLPLQSPRYAVAFDLSGDDTALVADFSEDPVWLDAAGCGLQIGGGADVPPLELSGRGGAVTSARCRPALLSLAAPLAGAVVEPAVAAEGTRVEFVSGSERLAQAPRRPIRIRPKPDDEEDKEAEDEEEEEKPKRPIRRGPIRIRPRPGTETKPGDEKPKPDIRRQPDGRIITRPGLTIADVALDRFLVPVLRALDLLSLTFQFVNLKLESGAGKDPRLVRVKPDEPTYIIVHFPPQHIAEQAFFEAAPEFKDTEDEPLAPPPVKTRLAGPSRLVFKVPEGMDEIPYTLPALLDWSRFDLSVAATALPLPAPARLRLRDPKTTKLMPRAKVSEAAKMGIVQPDRGTPSPLRRRVNLRNLKPDVTVRSDIVRPTLSAGVIRRLVPTEPKPTETALELPYRLILSPNESAGWVHSLTRVQRNKRVELWHTRLGVKSEDGTIHEDQYAYGWDEDLWRVVQVSTASSSIHDRYRTLRAIWSPDYAPELPEPEDTPFRMSLNPRDRCQLVWLMSNYTVGNCRRRAARTKKLMLTSLGAWLDTRYAFEPPKGGPGLNLEEWIHQATMARDQYVKVVEKGYLFPFGHRASLIKVTERKFEPAGSGSVAYLRQRFFIVVREPEKTYAAFGQQYDGRRMPFRKLTVTTLVTPNLNDPDKSGIDESGAAGQDCFWPTVGPDAFEFHMVGEDWDGEHTDFTVPAIFVSAAGNLSYSRSPMEKVCKYYNEDAPTDHTTRPAFGQKVAFADNDGAKPGDTALETETITFGAEVDDPQLNLTVDDFFDNNQACFYPTVAKAAVRIPAVVQVTGQSGPVDIAVDDGYVKNAWNAASNKGTVFARMLNASPLEFPGDKSGGLALPNIQMSGLSRQFGPIGGDPAAMAGGNFDPKEFFKDSAATLLGAVDLWEIIEGVFGDAEIPGLTIDTEKDENGIPTLVRATLEWTPKVKDAKPIFLAQADGAKATFRMKATVETPLSTNAEPTYDSLAKLRNFTIDLTAIIVKFNRIEFTASSGKKPDVRVDIKKVEFGGPLEFVNTLQKFLSDVAPGLALDVTPTGVYVGYAFGIPTVAVGVMSIQNINIGIALTLPFTGDPVRLRFAFCERQNPFLLTVSIFGGGGFFAIEVMPSGLHMLEASFEFGGNFSLNIGVASGGAYIMAGIYFKYEADEATLTGYVRCGGHLSVLGLITISCEFYLSLTYESKGNRCYGQAKLTVEIEILFFSFSVTLSVEREFAGSSGGGQASLHDQRLAALVDPQMLAQLRAGAGERPPKIQELLKPRDWKTYCEAFA